MYLLWIRWGSQGFRNCYYCLNIPEASIDAMVIKFNTIKLGTLQHHSNVFRYMFAENCRWNSRFSKACVPLCMGGYVFSVVWRQKRCCYLYFPSFCIPLLWKSLSLNRCLVSMIVLTFACMMARACVSVCVLCDTLLVSMISQERTPGMISSVVSSW